MNRLLLLDRHEPDLAPATLEITNHLEAARQNIGRSHLLQQSLFPTEILPVLIVHRSEMSGLALEESVARRTEPFPDLVGIAARHGPRLLPLGLQCDQLIGRLLPLLAVAQRFGRLAQLGLELEVVLHLALQPGIVGTLGLEEFVAGIAETLVDGIVIFLGSESDRFQTFCISKSFSLALFHSLREVSGCCANSSALTQSSLLSSRLRSCSCLIFSKNS